LRRDDENHEIRRYIGEAKVLQADLLPMLKEYWKKTDLFDVILRWEKPVLLIEIISKYVYKVFARTL
jgi:hypothetical protein